MSDPPASQNKLQPSEHSLLSTDNTSRLRQKPKDPQSNTEQKQYDPFADDWMALPAQISTDSNIPPALQRLANLENVIVRKDEPQMRVYESTLFYNVENTEGKKIFIASTVGGWDRPTTSRNWNPLDVRIADENRETAIYLHYEYTCATCWCCNCRKIMEVFSPASTLIGTVKDLGYTLSTEFSIHNERGIAEWRIKRTDCLLCNKDEFKVSTLDKKTVVAKVTKNWKHFWSKPHYDITFPLNFDIRMKAIIIGCCFLLISLEESEQRRSSRDRDSEKGDP